MKRIDETDSGSTAINELPAIGSGAVVKDAIPTDRLLTAKETAYHLGLPESWVYRAARRGEIPVVRVGKYRRFDYEEVRRAIDEKADNS